MNAEARTVRVRVELPNPGLKLKPGMYGTVTLQTDAVKMLVVPKEAVLDTGLRQLVFMDRGEGAYVPYPVKLGRRSQDSVEVLEGTQGRGSDRDLGQFPVGRGEQVDIGVEHAGHDGPDRHGRLADARRARGQDGRDGHGQYERDGGHARHEGDGKHAGHADGGYEGDGDEGMEGMKGPSVPETRQVAGLSLALTTVPENPKAGNVLLKLKLTDQAGKPVTNAQVLFVYTMPMPGMTDSKATARHTKDGLYEGKVMFGMGGTWVVTVNVTVPGQTTHCRKVSVLGRRREACNPP